MEKDMGNGNKDNGVNDNGIEDIRRLRWQCRRGMLELDVMLSAFLDNVYLQLPESEKETFKDLLKESDQSLYEWFTGRNQPIQQDYRDLILKIRNIDKTSECKQ